MKWCGVSWCGVLWSGVGNMSNKPEVLAVVEVVFLLVKAQSFPGELWNIRSFFAFDVFHLPQSVCSNDDASLNMVCMSVTLDTSHLAISPLNDDSLANNQRMSVTPAITQDQIGPCGPLEQSVGDAFRHAVMAALSSAIDLGAQTEVCMCVCVCERERERALFRTISMTG